MYESVLFRSPHDLYVDAAVLFEVFRIHQLDHQLLVLAGLLQNVEQAQLPLGQETLVRVEYLEHQSALVHGVIVLQTDEELVVTE